MSFPGESFCFFPEFYPKHPDKGRFLEKITVARPEKPDCLGKNLTEGAPARLSRTWEAGQGAAARRLAFQLKKLFTEIRLQDNLK